MGYSGDDNKQFYEVWLPMALLAIYGICVCLLLFTLTTYHSSLIVQNRTTQEEMRDKYSKWGGNPYDRKTNSNCLYFVRRQRSLVLDNP